MGKIRQRTLTEDEFQELIRQDGWVISGGLGAKDAADHVPVLSGFPDGIGFLIVTAEKRYMLGFGDWVVAANPYTLQVYRPKLQECNRPKELGGGKHVRRLPAVHLTLKNDVLRQTIIDDKLEVARIERDKNSARLHEAEKNLNILGNSITSVRVVAVAHDGDINALLSFNDEPEVEVYFKARKG